MDNKFFYAQLNRGDFGTIYFEDSHTLSIKWEDGKLENIQAGSNRGMGVHVQSGDESYYSYRGSWDLGQLKNLVDGMVGNLPERRKIVPLKADSLDFVHPIEKRPEDVPINQKIAILKNIDGIIRSFDPRIKQVVAGYGEKIKRVKIISTDGRVLTEDKVYVVMSVSVIAGEKGDIQTATEVVGGITGFEMVEKIDWKSFANRVSRLAVDKLEAPYLPAREMPVVIACEAGGTMIHEAIGHSLEADLVQKGISPYFAGKKGKKVASELVSILDDPTIPGKRGSYYIDDEGMVSKRCVLVENGILKDYLYDKYTALKDGVTSNAHGRRESFQSKPIPRMSNTFIKPGESKREDVIRSLKNGLLVKKMGGGQVNTATGDFVFEVEEGYIVKDGQVKNLVRGATLLGNGPTVLMDIDMLADDMGWGVGTCGKEGQGVPVSDGQPTLRIKNILVGGASESK